ncbi:2-dehydropantoate 2-reductase [Pigmentiphaga soli]|uniref:2-dehydropantoate 2-reductase n=1 Tax=Pigmentiphaga soli TaxID=1007095 RepID=A0ABP8GM51_9BURK
MKRIVIVGAGAVGSHIGALLTKHDQDITLLDYWHEHVEAIRREGVRLSGMSEADSQTIRVNAMHMAEAAQLAHQKPVDIAIVATKSYDTEWATMMIRPYLAADGFVVSLQNCINEERIAGIVGWGRTVGCIAARISVELYAPGQVRRQAPTGAAHHTVFRVGEIHGRVTPRVSRLAELLSLVDTAKVTTNLWGERWAKLSHNAMRNGVAAVTGMRGNDIDGDEAVRRFTIMLGAEAVQVGQALGYELEKVGKIDPRTLARADTDAQAYQAVEDLLVKERTDRVRGDLQRPSTGQDILKGRRTEIEFINGYVADQGRRLGIATPYNEKVTRLVNEVERGTIQPDPRHIKEIA